MTSRSPRGETEAETVEAGAIICSPVWTGGACLSTRGAEASATAGDGERVGARRLDEPGTAEPAHRAHDRQQRTSLRRQLVLDARRRLRIAAADHDPLVLQHLQPLRQRPRADPGTRVLELSEAPRSLRE